VAVYLLRAIKQVAVYELTGKERVVEADSEQQLGRMVREFLAAEFPGELGAPPDIEVEVKRQGQEVPITDKPLPSEFQPKNKGAFSPGKPIDPAAPF